MTGPSSRLPDFGAIWWETAKAAKAAQIEYGRWIVNTLWLMHSGAIAGLLSKWDGKTAPSQSTAIGFFVAGIVLAFATAALAWLNFTVADAWFRKWTFAGDNWAEQDVKTLSIWLQRSMYAAVACVGFSLFCLVIGVVCVLRS